MMWFHEPVVSVFEVMNELAWEPATVYHANESAPVATGPNIQFSVGDVGVPEMNDDGMDEANVNVNDA
jgi:hypothetical protein